MRFQWQRLSYLLSGFWLVAIVVLVSGCSNYGSGWYSNSMALTDAQNGDQSGYSSCTWKNANPYDNWMLDVPGIEHVGEFDVCRGEGNKVIVKGLIRPDEDKLCLFPATKQGQYLVPIAEEQGFMKRICRTFQGENGTSFDFGDTEFEGGFLVEEKHVTQMNACLVVGDPELCPNAYNPMNMGYWSYGSF